MINTLLRIFAYALSGITAGTSTLIFFLSMHWYYNNYFYYAAPDALVRKFLFCIGLIAMPIALMAIILDFLSTAKAGKADSLDKSPATIWLSTSKWFYYSLTLLAISIGLFSRLLENATLLR